LCWAGGGAYLLQQRIAGEGAWGAGDAGGGMDQLFKDQLERLREYHFLILFWAAEAEVKGLKYNITNAFDDLKDLGITRTKQSVMGYVESLHMLCFIDLKEERNRKNIYLAEHGAEALESLVENSNFKTKKSRFMEGM
jgi:hypothetical protein